MLTLLLEALGCVRALFRRRVVDPLTDPNSKISRARFLRMMETLFVCEARTRRGIFETALAMLGAEVERQPLGAFRLPRPRTPREVSIRFAAHARMSAHADWYAWRLARRLRKMVRLARDPISVQLARPSCRPFTSTPVDFTMIALEPVRLESGSSRQRAPPFSQALPKSA